MQRVLKASVTVAGEVVGAIDEGMAVLLGVENGDGPRDVAYMIKKLSGLRIFSDAEGLMNLSVAEAGGAVLVISQFTLLGDVRKGMRPSFTGAAPPEQANELYEEVNAGLRAAGLQIATGQFQADMKVDLVGDGPVTILLDSRKLL